MQSNINNVNKTWVLLQTTGGKEVTKEQIILGQRLLLCVVFFVEKDIIYIYDIINIKEVKIDDST
jgi:hypothetical protein